MVKDHSYSERGNRLSPLRVLLFPINSKGSFICTIPHTRQHILRHSFHKSLSTSGTRNTSIGPLGGGGGGVDPTTHRTMSRRSTTDV